MKVSPLAVSPSVLALLPGLWLARWRASRRSVLVPPLLPCCLLPVAHGISPLRAPLALGVIRIGSLEGLR